MKKYFVISDVHSFYSLLKQALEQANFDINNEEHILILAGDLFDRGEDSLALYEFIKSIPKERRILIRGNHEYLFEEMINRCCPMSHDFSNGTVRTLFQLAGFTEEQYNGFRKIYSYFGGSKSYEDLFYKATTKKKVKEYLKWIRSKEWKDYYEMDNFIFVHAFIPVVNDTGVPMYYASPEQLKYNKDWRAKSTFKEVEDSTWGCPWQLYNAGLFEEEAKAGKILVCGHWHAEDFHRVYENDFNNYEIYFGEHLIALDACTAYSDMCNVLVIEDGKCYDKYGKLLEYKKIDQRKEN